MWEPATNNFNSRASEVWQLFGDWASAHLLQIIIIIIIAEIAYKVSVKAISRIIYRATRRAALFPSEADRKKRVKTLNGLIKTGARIVTIVVASIMVISELGVNTAPLIASAGIIGVALGFGAQSLIRDFMSGLFIIAENQYRIGDVVELSTTVGAIKVIGTVESISIRTTVIRDLDGRVHHVPNGNILVATNLTMDFARINEDIVVSVDTDIDRLEHAINHIGKQIAARPEFSKVIIEPIHFERVDRISDNGLTVKILGKTIPGDQWAVKGELYRRLPAELKKQNIKIP